MNAALPLALAPWFRPLLPARPAQARRPRRLLAVLVLLWALPAAAQDSACLNWRWVGVTHTATTDCAALAPEGWLGEPLFAANAEETPPGLRRYCLFESTTPAPPPESSLLDLSNRLAALDRDCVGVAPQSDDRLGALQWQALEAHFQAQAGRPQNVALAPGPAAVRLAVLDSNPTNAVDPETDMGASPHGNALISMAEDLLCDASAACSAQVTSRLALRFVRVNPDRREPADVDARDGGHLGSLADLARALHEELVAWKSAVGPSRLVLNLSVGWDARLGGSEAQVAAMPAPAQAVYAALAEARCHSALVFAAAGNHAGDPLTQREPLLPAAWEARPAPTAFQCQQLLGPGFSPAPAEFASGSYRPLVHAVSGIEADGSELDNARINGTARLAAYGDHAVVQSQARTSSSPTAILTGSSVASLLASSNAALAWSYQPGLTSAAVVDLLHGAALGTPSVLPRAADVCLRGIGGTCAAGASPVSHRLSLCLTALAAGALALTPLDCTWQPAHSDLTLDYSAFDAAAITLDLLALTARTSHPDCPGQDIRYSSAHGLPRRPCPHLSLPALGEQPWLLPQPGSNLCPSCGEDDSSIAKSLQAFAKSAALPSRSLRLELSQRLTERVTAISLVVANRVFVLPLPHPLGGGDRVRITGLESLPAGTERGLVAFAVNDTIATTSAVHYAD